jgi:hypothetical protein
MAAGETRAETGGDDVVEGLRSRLGDDGDDDSQDAMRNLK